MRTAFSHKQDEKLFLANILGDWQTVFGKNFTNLSLKFGVLIVGEMEQQMFHTPATFRMAKKVW